MVTIQNIGERDRHRPICPGTAAALQMEGEAFKALKEEAYADNTVLEAETDRALEVDMSLALAEESDSCKLYALLASFFLTGPDEDWLLAVQEMKLAGAASGQEEYVGHVEALKALIAAEPEEKITLWQTEYTRLFLGPGQVPAYPYESVYRSPRRLLMQEVTAGVRRVYLEQGLIMAKLYRQPEDHLGVELEFLGYLQKKKLKESQKAGALAEVQREFILSHLLPWIPDFAKDIITNTEEPLFREIAGLLQEFLVGEELRLSTKI